MFLKNTFEFLFSVFFNFLDLNFVFKSLDTVLYHCRYVTR